MTPEKTFVSVDLLKNRKSDDNRDEIIRYLREGGEESGIVLTELQEKMLHRWRFADEKIREKKYSREQIAKFIMSSCSCSRDTAFKAMSDAEHVFASSYPLNKKYLVGLRIDFLIGKIHEQYISGDSIGAAMNEKTLQKYISDYPEATPAHSPKNVFFIFNKNETHVTVDAETAYQESIPLLEKLENSDDY